MIHSLAERCFRLSEHKTDLRTELCAGLTTFLTMAYILAVNSAILGFAGMDQGGVLIATALTAFAGTVFMGLYANLPLALAPAMGLNVYFVSAAAQLGSWQLALFAVFLEGIIFLLLALTGLRRMLFRAIPVRLQKIIGYGIGFFVLILGLRISGRASFSTEVPASGLCCVLALAGLILSAVLLRKKVRGGLLYGILFTWGVGMLCQLAGWYRTGADSPSLIPDFSFSPLAEAGEGFCGIAGAAFDVSAWSADGKNAWRVLCSGTFLSVLFSLLFLDLFSALGTLTGLVRRKPAISRAFTADALSTPLGAVLGTSTVTTYVESATGMAAGGRTGLTALTAGFLFLPAILFAPVFLAIPPFAVAPALLIVGFYMSYPVCREVKLRRNTPVQDYLPVLLTGVGMYFDITAGISLGILSWTVLNLLTGHRKRVSRLLILLSLVILAKYIFL